MNRTTNKTTDPLLFWIGLKSIPGVGRTTFRKIIAHFGSPERGLSASQNELKAIGLSEKVSAQIATYPWREEAERELLQAAKAGVTIINSDDERYPAMLREIEDPPLYLYVKGAVLPQDGNAVAIVGTRKPTYYGKNFTRRLASELASAGLTIVSGLARGIDTEAHRGALEGKGRTIAVLGSGVDVPYPPENEKLLNEIASSGAVISENPFGTQPEAGYFPGRNRIISGLSRGTVIIEAAEDSGSLITAKNALEQRRKLFAVPGNVGSVNSKGPNSLIKQGATLIESAEDLLKALGTQAQRQIEATVLPSLSEEEIGVFQSISTEPKHIDVIMIESQSSAGKLSGILTTLELKGLAKQLPGKYFVRQQ